MKRKNLYVSLRNRINSLFLISIITFTMMLLSSTVFAQKTKTVNGTVKDKSGISLPGVTIVVKGTTTGTISDVNGNFSFNIPAESQILVFSFVGMKPQEIPIKSNSTFNVIMVAETIGIEEVVAVGYGTQKRATLTGSVETVREEVFKDRATTSPALALQGQTPGLVVTRSTSRPGNESIDLQIRGKTSVNGGDPLIVIDGAPAINKEAFFNMNADDIESISVLKDGSAAIYGSRAANGVILVTTKRGKGKTNVNINSTVRINSIGIRPPTPTMQEYATVWLEAAKQDGANANYWGWESKKNMELMQSGYEGIYETLYWGDVFIGNYPRFDEMYGTSVSNQTNGSISGSSEKSKYRLSFDYSEDIGALQTSYDGKKQYNGRFNYDINLANWLKLETSISYTNYKISSPSCGLGVTSISYDPPFFPAKNPYGQWYANFNIAGNRNAIAATVDGGRETTKRDQFKINLSAIIDLYKDLSLKVRATLNKDFYEYQKYVLTVPTYTWYGEVADEEINSTSSIREKRTTKSYQSYDAILNYKKNIGGHNFSAMAGITAEKLEDKTLYGYRQGFEDYGVYDLNLGSEDEKVEANGGAGNWGLYSYIGRLNYNYKNKYLIELQGRRDGSSKFAKGYKWANFGGTSVGWVITEEPFMKKINFLDFAKLRASYGEMGNQAGISNHGYLSQMGFGTAVFGQNANQQTTAWVDGITTNVRTWETVKITTYGIDLRFIDNKLNATIEYFQKKNNKMLASVTYPSILGDDAPKTNSGKLETKGWEFLIGYHDQINDFKYKLTLNISNTWNKLIYMEGADSYSAGLVKKRQGYALNTYFLYQTDGLLASEEEVTDYYSNYGSGGEITSRSDVAQRLRAGDTKKIDLDGNGYIDDVSDEGGDVKDMGDNAPHYVYGINFGAKWKNFDFSAFFQGVLDQNILRTGYSEYPFTTLWTNQTAAYIGKTWTETNTDAKYPRMTANTVRSKWNWKNNDFMLQNNRYIRLKSLVLGYSFSNIKISKYNIDKFRIYFSGSDLFELTSVKDGYDPEYGESSNNSYPFTRTWSLGVNLNF